MIIDPALAEASPLRTAIRDRIRGDETEALGELIDQARLPDAARGRIAERARDLVAAVRRENRGRGGLDSFLREFGLSSREGVVLLCLAEALLRVPDAGTVDKLIKDKIATADWQTHLGASESIFVNASTWALMLTGRVVRLDEGDTGDLAGILRRLIHDSGEPVIRGAVTQAMRILGRQFVMGRTIGEALARAKSDQARGYRFSYDMLGEAARTMADARRYLAAYRHAITEIGQAPRDSGGDRNVFEAPGVSVKLSALHPRYVFAQRARVLEELVPHLKSLALEAKTYNIGLTVDAEEADRLDLSLDVIEAVSGDPDLAGWEGFGLAVQAYQKRAPLVLDWLAEMARRHRRRLMIRLVKGAYWDTEIKLGQEAGLDGYPVFTRKVATDVCYLACAKRILVNRDFFYPQFATHNAQTLAAVLEMAGGRRDLEFQRLHGMGETLYRQVVGKDTADPPVRIYAPVGSHEELLAYLVRRLLENGANTSFVNRIQDEALPIDEIIADPVAKARELAVVPHPKIPLPADLYGSERRNSAGLDLADPQVMASLGRAMDRAGAGEWTAAPRVAGPQVGEGETSGPSRAIVDPADNRREVGRVIESDGRQIEAALAAAHRAAAEWDATPAEARAACLERMAGALESQRALFMALCVREAGKTIPDALSEVREAVDFCRYYASRARADFAAPQVLPGPTGERNEVSLHGRGVFVCISPWNFPLAIFMGQVSAALAAGNPVIAKPSGQTPLIADAAVRLLHGAGVPGEVLHLLPGEGRKVGDTLVRDPRVAGIVFTGSTETARSINRTLAAREGPIIPFIAETGGQNAMIVDSTALPEQVTDDVIVSAFQSAGQRCSALRVLFLQEEVADKMLAMLSGAMVELVVGDPGLLATDVGPVIDSAARETLEDHARRMAAEGRLIARTVLTPGAENGSFFAPVAFEIEAMSILEREVFGPILHVVRYRADCLDGVLDAINGAGYGLTVGIHSRIESTVEHIHRRLRVGNAYVNRNMIGAVVGVQPFGGEGLSGTGPKAGGPRYLHRFATERTLSVNTTAAGGNASLLSLASDLPV